MGVKKPKDCFLWFMSLVYLFAFTSLYVQLPGLYGDNGILPAKLKLKSEVNSWQQLLDGKPTLLKLMPRIGLDAATGMDLLTLLGMAISFVCVVSSTARDVVSFTLLWMFYLSLFHVGQTFLSFQWDILLLEAGFLTILVAPFNMTLSALLGKRRPRGNAHDGVTLWLVRWLLFRLMFASGVVKLTSMCQQWWGLTALNVHFESQCIPTPLAWYFHQMPSWFLKLSVVATYVIEIAVPFLFFSPVRSLKMFAFWSQIMLQMLIVLTGNYNFFNLLTITLCVSLLDDQCFLFTQPRYTAPPKKKSTLDQVLDTIATKLMPPVVLGYLTYQTITLFNLKLNDDYTISSKIGFTKKQFERWLGSVMPYTVILGAASLGLEIVIALVKSVTTEKDLWKKLSSIASTVLFSVAALFMFSISLVPLSQLEQAMRYPTYHRIPAQVKSWSTQVDQFKLTSSYGLFRSMTGVGGRPEVIIEGHATDKDAKNGWQAYHFMHKPGNVSQAPSIVAPHQPRLDWQMWFAALGHYDRGNEWFINMAYRLLQNQQDVLELIDVNPFPSSPPKYIRATLYLYHYTSVKSCAGKPKCSWWRRDKQREYMPATSLQDKWLKTHLGKQRMLQDKGIKKVKATNMLARGVVWARTMIGQPEGFSLSVSMFGSAVCMMFLNKAMF